MHIVTPFQPQFRLINRNRDSWEYRTLDAALKALWEVYRHSGYRFFGELLNDRFDTYTTIATVNGFSRVKHEAHFVITDPNGNAVDLDTLKSVYWSIRAKKRPKSPHKGVFREGNWPNIHCYRRHRGSWSRLITTTQEKRWAFADNDDLAEIGWHPAKAGRTRDLPNARDGIHKYRGKCWKKYRATQWR